jgi:hypothetical protein
MADQIIPLDTSPQQSFTIAVNVDGLVLRLGLDITFSEMAQYWLMDVKNSQGVVILASVPMITGDWPAANLLQQYGYLGIGSAYILNASQVAADYPDNTNLGTDFVLLWSDTAP